MKNAKLKTSRAKRSTVEVCFAFFIFLFLI